MSSSRKKYFIIVPLLLLVFSAQAFAGNFIYRQYQALNSSEGSEVAKNDASKQTAVEINDTDGTPNESLESTEENDKTDSRDTTKTVDTDKKQETNQNNQTTNATSSPSGNTQPIVIPQLPNNESTQNSGTSLDPALRARLFPGWCNVGLTKPANITNVTATVNPGESIQAAVNSVSSGVVLLKNGTHSISSTVQLKSGVVLRGESLGANIKTTAPMNSMITIGGGYFGQTTYTVSSGPQFSDTLQFSGGSLYPGFWIIGDSSRGQIVKINSVSGSTAMLDEPLGEDFTGFDIKELLTPATRAGIENLTLTPLHEVGDLVFLRSVYDVWVDGIKTHGGSGQRRSAIYMRQAYKSFVTNNYLDDAKEHGDGGQGYGINIANNTSSSLITDNTLRHFRHSILLHGGATGNVVARNDSNEALHPNFQPGGPGDMSFHGYSTANLVRDNYMIKIHINDAGVPGPNNTLAFNTLHTSPLTLGGGIDNLTILGNTMEGDVDTLRNKIMPSIATNSTAGNPSPPKPYWIYSSDPFEDTGYGHGIYDTNSGTDIYVDRGMKSLDVCSI